MNIIKILCILFVLLIFIISIKKPRWSITAFWIGIFLIPYPIENSRLFGLNNVYWQALAISFSGIFNKTILQCIKNVFLQNRKILNFFLIFDIIFILLSSTVPSLFQFRYAVIDYLSLFFILLTYQYSKVDIKFPLTLTKGVTIAILINIIFCLYFELLLGFNPTGTPLYILMGAEDNMTVVDMIESARGSLNLRLQSITGHPLSLGQYFLLLLPLYMLLTNRNSRFSTITAISITIIIFLTGTRGAIIPSLLIWCYFIFINKLHIVFKRIMLIILLIIAFFQFIPSQHEQKINNIINTYAASLAFWDDNLQSKTSIGGSNMAMRFEQFKAAQNEIKDNPFWGKGLGYREYYQIKHQDVHPVLLGYESFVLLKLVEQGWIGLLFYLIIFWILYLQFRKRVKLKSYITITFITLLISELMTGIRPYSFLILGMVCTLINFYESSNYQQYDNRSLKIH